MAQVGSAQGTALFVQSSEHSTRYQAAWDAAEHFTRSMEESNSTLGAYLEAVGPVLLLLLLAELGRPGVSPAQAVQRAQAQLVAALAAATAAARAWAEEPKGGEWGRGVGWDRVGGP